MGKIDSKYGRIYSIPNIDFINDIVLFLFSKNLLSFVDCFLLNFSIVTVVETLQCLSMYRKLSGGGAKNITKDNRALLINQAIYSTPLAASGSRVKCVEPRLWLHRIKI